MRGQRKNPRKAVQPFENKKRKIDIFKNYEANGVEKIQRKLEIFSTLISKKSRQSFKAPTKEKEAKDNGFSAQLAHVSELDKGCNTQPTLSSVGQRHYLYTD